ncbi:Protein-lysine N-methyltransferase EFM6 [Paramyrothecium foliicola]|nr:Protein-lysine N-methyltransferase EFM6 [Paramyrothecium foliicola]
MGSPPSSPEIDPTAISEDFAPLPTLKEKGNAQLDFDGQLPEPIKVHEDCLIYVTDPFLTDSLELGAGGGLVGLAVAKGCGVQSRMLLTDQLEMLELMQHNIQLNDLESRVSALILNWGEALPQMVIEQRPDVIIAAECVYFEPAFPLLMKTLHDLFEVNPDATVYFCFKKRRRADMQFVKSAKKAFRVEELFDEDRPIFQRQALFLFAFTSRVSGSAVNGNGRVKGGNDKGDRGRSEESIQGDN